ncbi:MAG TPA: DUF3152 domain-containing protein [Micromonosporaceae bacterium]
MTTTRQQLRAASERARRRGGGHRRRRARNPVWPIWAASLIVVVGALTVVVSAAPLELLGLAGSTSAQSGDRPSPAPPPTIDPSPSAAPSETASPSPPEPVLRLPGPVRSAGSGAFAYADEPGEVFGTAGTLRRFRVAVEQGAEVDVAEFAAAVDRALGDPRSWIASGRLRLQRVPNDGSHNFTIYLATAQTAGRMCGAGGINIRVGGKPYTSCRLGGKVIINLDRWQLSVDHLVQAGVPLDTYRDYVINHEVGHELGHGHENCPGQGRPAPTMMQQTLYLDGCVANPWPYLDGRRYAGPPR